MKAPALLYWMGMCDDLGSRCIWVPSSVAKWCRGRVGSVVTVPDFSCSVIIHLRLKLVQHNLLIHRYFPI